MHSPIANHQTKRLHAFRATIFQQPIFTTGIASMWTPAILTALICCTAHHGLRIASGAFALIALIWTRIELYADIRLRHNTRWPLLAREQFLEHILKPMPEGIKTLQLKCCGRVSGTANASLLIHHLTLNHTCPYCGQTLFRPPKPWEEVFVKIAAGGIALAFIRDVSDLTLRLLRLRFWIFGDDAPLALNKKVLLVLLVLWQLNALVTVESAIRFRRYQWWRSWTDEMFCGFSALPVAVFWAAWLPWEFQRAFDAWRTPGMGL